jgi:A/G-specific adenine glycosylase
MSRLHAIDASMPAGRSEVARHTLAIVPPDRPGDFAQALIDLGSGICTPRRPACALCPWMQPCRARDAGTQENYPRKLPKKEGALRRGLAFVVLREDDAILLRTRPPKGLLGGMAEVPTSAWGAKHETADGMADAPLTAPWLTANTPVRHVFTHFPLELTVLAARVPMHSDQPDVMRFTALGKLGDEPLSSLMLKVIEAGLTVLGKGRA